MNIGPFAMAAKPVSRHRRGIPPPIFNRSGTVHLALHTPPLQVVGGPGQSNRDYGL